MAPILALRDVSRRFARRGRVVAALDGVRLDVAAGELVTVVGPSGCGKSTLLNLIAGLLPPSAGQVVYKGAGARRQHRDRVRHPGRQPLPLARPRDLFHLHDDAGFRVTYDALWDDLAGEVRRAAAQRRDGAGPDLDSG